MEREEEVGPFAVQVLASANPDELATWLVDNGYDLTDRGRELIAPYVEAGMKFVALELRSGQSSGAIQPLIMRYTSERPTVPIRLTAVAAQDDTGVLVWTVADALAVPSNYLHVKPNYTRLNWYAGPGNAYAIYQSLITDAMNEAGGQGFATDFTGPIDASIADTLSDVCDRESLLVSLDESDDDARWLSGLWLSAFEQAVQLACTNALPVQDNEDASTYSEPLSVSVSFTAEELDSARESIRAVYIDQVITPLRDSTALFPEEPYLTRLYTTLSADEAPAQTDDLNAVWQTEITSADAEPEVTLRRDFKTLEFTADGSSQGGSVIDADSDDDDDGFLGGNGVFGLLALLGALGLRRRWTLRSHRRASDRSIACARQARSGTAGTGPRHYRQRHSG